MKNLGLYFYEEIISNEYFASINKKLTKAYSIHIIDGVKNYTLTQKEESDLFRFIDILSSIEDQSARMRAYHIISQLDAFISNNERFKFISSSVYSKLGLFALNFNDHKLPFDRRIENETKRKTQKYDDNFIFTDAQYEIYSRMLKYPHYSFSGPTSLGKSFIIKRYIENIVRESCANIIILVPSKALINQYSIEIKNELRGLLIDKKYNILTHGNLINDEKDNHIFILTPERLLSLYSQNCDIRIDFLFVDEAHKLANTSDSDTRSLTAYSAIENTISRNINVKVVFSSPNISNPEIFLELFGKNVTYSTRVAESPVAQNLFLIDFKDNEITFYGGAEKYSIDTKILETTRRPNDFIYKVGGRHTSNMVYCSSRKKSIEAALDFYENYVADTIQTSKKIEAAIEKLSSYIHKEFYLASFLKKRIAYHHGRLPSIVRNIIEELFRDGEINFIFCTPTLVEGVNMPTKNIFINCDSKIRLVKEKDKNASKSIAFWNLAGRAGRYCKELSGNIFCIQNEKGERWEDTSIFEKKNTIISTAIDASLSSRRSLNEIEKALISKCYDSQEISKLIEYLANLASIDAIRFNLNLSQSFLLRKFIELNENRIINLAKEKSTIIENIPLDIINTYKSLDFSTQAKVFNHIKSNPKSSILPKLDYEHILSTLKSFYHLYKWDIAECNYIKSENQLTYFALLMNSWINGKSINTIISDSISNREKIQITKGDGLIDFDKTNQSHINHLIDETLHAIENILTFTFEKYFTHYYKCLCSVLGEENAGKNWSTFLEYGSKIPMEIELQNLGLSRYTSHNIYSKSELHECIVTSTTGEIVKINKEKLLSRLPHDSIEYSEIVTLL